MRLTVITSVAASHSVTSLTHQPGENQHDPNLKSFKVEGAQANYFYGSEKPEELEFGICIKFESRVATFTQKEISNNAKLLRFASLYYFSEGYFDIVSTGFERDFDEYISDEWIASPSDTVLGMYRWRIPRPYPGSSKTIPANKEDACASKDFSSLATIDKIYARLVGSTVENGSWKIYHGTLHLYTDGVVCELQ
jgi:hypothetical protein